LSWRPARVSARCVADCRKHRDRSAIGSTLYTEEFGREPVYALLSRIAGYRSAIKEAGGYYATYPLDGHLDCRGQFLHNGIVLIPTLRRFANAPEARGPRSLCGLRKLRTRLAFGFVSDYVPRADGRDFSNSTTSQWPGNRQSGHLYGTRLSEGGQGGVGGGGTSENVLRTRPWLCRRFRKRFARMVFSASCSLGIAA